MQLLGPLCTVVSPVYFFLLTSISVDNILLAKVSEGGHDTQCNTLHWLKLTKKNKSFIKAFDEMIQNSK